MVASEMGCRAVNMLYNGQGNKVIAVKNDKLIDYDISEALDFKKEFDINLYNEALKISI